MKRIYLYYTTLFLTSSLYLTERFNEIGSVLIGILILFTFPLALFTLKKKLMISSPFLGIVMLLYMVIGLISGVLNKDFTLMLNGVTVFILYVASFIIMPSFSINNYKHIYRSNLWSQIPLLIFPLLIMEVSTPYQGVFYNPNSFGTIVVTLFTVIISVYFSKVEDQSIKDSYSIFSQLRYILSLLFLFYLIILSGSRTSFLAALIVSFVGGTLLFIKISRKGNKSPALRLSFILLLSGIGLLFLFTTNVFSNAIYDNIISKFIFYQGDAFNSRSYIWNKTINEAQWFGNGGNYFINLGIGSHNTFIGVLGEEGWLAVILFSIFILYGLFYALRYAMDGKDVYQYMPLLVIICFTALSMAEGMMFQLSMLNMFFCLGSLPYVKSNNRRI